ncbi:hypothetical protein IV498_06920 [Paenarthrobacter sp. Z7-10]|uniref:hypothetical protein n=1 Tax=Paenarthrobacter sp. Z7-10 TaxID=2787635 RepID=UPI0022A8EF76|nr:hypothetical protein [Paenarthrobacter sp. Z7-10]MCZ2402921.1 hypothetical protein [Paenarthrobacter sp. Z7-10]
MTAHSHPLDNDHARHDGADLAELLVLDAEVHGVYLDEATAWVAQLAPANTRSIIDWSVPVFVDSGLCREFVNRFIA